MTEPVPSVEAQLAVINTKLDLLIAGKDELRLTTVTSVQPLDREATRLQLGPKADPASHTEVRGWIGPSVMMRLSNPDPVPYWLVSTRRPEELAAAIKSERTAARTKD